MNGSGTAVSSSGRSSLANWSPDLKHVLKSLSSIFANTGFFRGWANYNTLISDHVMVVSLPPGTSLPAIDLMSGLG